MVTPVKMLPPDEQQNDLAKEINQKLQDAKVSFYRTIGEDGGTRWGVIYQYGTARKNVVSDVPHHDPDDIVRRVNRWIAGLHQGQRWGLAP